MTSEKKIGASFLFYPRAQTEKETGQWEKREKWIRNENKIENENEWTKNDRGRKWLEVATVGFGDLLLVDAGRKVFDRKCPTQLNSTQF